MQDILYFQIHVTSNSICQRRIWTPPRLQAICILTIKYDCIRISGLYSLY
jgi:hypothetical protein